MSLKQQLLELVKRNELDQVFKLLPEDNSTVISLRNRYSRFYASRISGITSRENLNIEQNNIVDAILMFIDTLDENGGTTPPTPNSTAMTSLEDLHNHYRRRDPDFAAEIYCLLEDFSKYENQKSTTPGFDTSGRRLRVLIVKKQSLLSKHRERSLDSLESKTAKIVNLLKDNVPSWDNLQEAWNISHGLGMSSTWIPQALQNRADDAEVRIKVAEAIETFL